LPPQIVTGATHVPGNGQPILLLTDHQTIGGSPKLCTVASVDLPRLSRHRPGQQLRFMPIEVADAETQRRVRETAFRRLLTEIAPLGAVPQTEDLLTANLISGVVSAGTD
jgi:allophanate hydrolase subunit 2